MQSINHILFSLNQKPKPTLPRFATKQNKENVSNIFCLRFNYIKILRKANTYYYSV